MGIIIGLVIFIAIALTAKAITAKADPLPPAVDPVKDKHDKA